MAYVNPSGYQYFVATNLSELLLRLENETGWIAKIRRPSCLRLIDPPFSGEYFDEPKPAGCGSDPAVAKNTATGCNERRSGLVS